jgi:hypothetical protein
MYYRLTNFYQNHRLYIKNLDADQLLGTASTGSTIHTNCDPLATNDDGLWIYPCGLIANSMFNGKPGEKHDRGCLSVCIFIVSSPPCRYGIELHLDIRQQW